MQKENQKLRQCLLRYNSVPSLNNYSSWSVTSSNKHHNYFFEDNEDKGFQIANLTDSLDDRILHNNTFSIGRFDRNDK